jgi:maleylacetate reductase
MRKFVHRTYAGRVVFGEGSVQTVGAELLELGGRRVMVIASPRLKDTVRRICGQLGGAAVLSWDEVAVHVPAPLADRALAAAEKAGVDTVVTLGGGSAIGLGKAIAARRTVHLAAVPTTYAGSELNPVWGMTTDGDKRTRHDPRVLPELVVYDPDLLAGIPVRLAVESSFNAMAHCAEAVYAKGRSPITDLLALNGLRALTRAAGGYAAGKRADAGADALYGAFLGGTVLALADVSVHHKTAHVIGGLYDVAHAATHAALLPHALHFVASRSPESIAPASEAVGGYAPQVIFDLARANGLRTLGELGLTGADLPEIRDRILQRPPFCPVPLTPGGLDDYLMRALRGTRPFDNPDSTTAANKEEA